MKLGDMVTRDGVQGQLMFLALGRNGLPEGGTVKFENKIHLEWISAEEWEALHHE